MIFYLGCVNYIYDDKYYLIVIFCWDGIFCLVKENCWGNFFFVFVVWRIFKESFFKVFWIDDLKIRGNWGCLGNVFIGDWDYVGIIN